MAYRCLRSLNPSPYMFYLDAGDFQIAGSSRDVSQADKEINHQTDCRNQKTFTLRPEAEIVQELQ